MFKTKYLLLVVISIISSLSYGQMTNVRIGGNASAGVTFVNASYNGFAADEDTSGVIATMIPVNVDFAPWKFLSFNAGFKTGSWLNEDPNNTDIVIKKKTTSTFLLGFKLYPVMKENFHLYFGYDLGFGGFQTIKQSTGVIFWEDYQKWGGTNNNVNFGMNWYFKSAFGMFFQLGYTGYNFKLKEYTINNKDQVNDNLKINANMAVKGAQVELGFAYKFGEIE